MNVDQMSRLFAVLTTFFCAHLFAQTQIDSLKNLLDSSPEKDNIEVRLSLAEAYIDNNLNKSDEQLDRVQTLINEDSEPEYLIRYHLARSVLLRTFGELKESKQAAYEALNYTANSVDSILYKSKVYNALGAASDDQSDIENAIEYHLIALRYAEASGIDQQVATVCAGLGRAYMFLEEYDIAEQYYLRAIGIKERRKEYDKHLGNYYTNLSSCFDAKGNYELSLEYIDKAIELKLEANSYISVIPSYNNKAYTLFLMQQYPDAIKSVKRAIYLADSLEYEVEKMYAFSTYAEILFAQNKISEAENYMSKSIAMSRKNNDLYLAKYNLDLMYNIYLKKGDYKQALEYYKDRSVVMDSIFNLKKRSEVEKLALEYETEKKNKEIALLNAQNELNEFDLRKSRQLQLAFLIAALLALAVLLLLWSRLKNKKKTDLLLKEAMQRGFEKKLADSELMALRAQMNPHFLFNCLNSINSFIIKNEQEQASEYLAKFSKLIRRVLSNSKQPKVTLADELEALKLYIEMEALRFGNQFEYTIEVAPEIELDYMEVPPLIIQPYVENSIWHGLMHKKEGVGRLFIKVDQHGEHLIFTIEDNGIGRAAAAALKSKSAEKRKSFGMNITSDRLKYLNKLDDETTAIEIIDLQDDSGGAKGTKVIIRLNR